MRKKKINQRTGNVRPTSVDDDYGQPHHMSYCGAKQTAICPKCRYNTRVIRVSSVLPSNIETDARGIKVLDGMLCPKCREPLIKIGQRLRLPKKHKWNKFIPRLK